MNTKIVLLGIAIVAIGLFALPQTMALFLGQHDWYDTTTNGVNVPCQKCHADVLKELNQPGGTNTAHRTQEGSTGTPAEIGGCVACHVTTAPQTKEGLTVGPGGSFHAAAAPACLDCHGGGLSPGPGLSAIEILTGNDEVHKPFATAARDTSQILKSANEACVACHTHIAANIKWTKATTLELDAAESVPAPNAAKTWVVDNFRATGVAVINTNGNGDGTGTSTP